MAHGLLPLPSKPTRVAGVLLTLPSLQFYFPQSHLPQATVRKGFMWLEWAHQDNPE